MLRGSLRSIAGGFEALRTDYEKMLSAGMMYGDPLSFDKIISDIQEIEHAINDW